MSTIPCCLLCFLALFSTSSFSLAKDDDSDWKQLKDLKRDMYVKMKYRACVKLLNNTGAQGCEAAGDGVITAPIVHIKDLSRVTKGRWVTLVPIQAAEQFLTQLLASPSLRNLVAGVLLNPTTGLPSSQSVASTFPGAAYALYDNKSYVWNPAGTGFNKQWFGIPMYMLTPELANATVWRADYNGRHGLKGRQYVAKMNLRMEAEGSSVDCIGQQTCLPVGSYGVWAAVPPLPDPFFVNASCRPTTLVLAQMDGNALFQDLAKAAGTSLSGLIAGMVAVTLLVQSNYPANYTRQLAFAALPGEAFDYMGSKRLLYEMYLNTTSFARGLNFSCIDQVVEVGQVGMAWNRTANQSTFYLHTQRTGGYGDASTLLAAAQAAADVEAPLVAVQPASPSNPGIPPSSLMSFLRIKPSLAGLVLEDFDSTFQNPFYTSEFDYGGNVQLQSIEDAAVLLARTLHALLLPPPPGDGTASPPPLPVNRTEVTALVANFSQCLISRSPGMNCALATALMQPDIQRYWDGTSSAEVDAYPSVLRSIRFNAVSSSSKPNLPRFVFNYLGNLTAAPPTNVSADGAKCYPSDGKCLYPLACIGWRYGTKVNDALGVCRNTTTAYFPAYSTRFFYGLDANNYTRWFVTNRSLGWEARFSWPDDPMWTESNWPDNTPQLTVYQQESTTTQVIVLVVGLVLSAATGLASWAGVKVFEKHLKTQ